MDISFSCSSISATKSNYTKVDAEAIGVESSEILDHFNEDDVIKHFGVSGLLDRIGIDACQDHFNLTPNE